MDTSEKISAAKIVAEDLIKDLEKVVDRANAALDFDRRARDIHAESPELFRIQQVIVKTSVVVSQKIEDLLQVTGLNPYTRLTTSPTLMKR